MRRGKTAENQSDHDGAKAYQNAQSVNALLKVMPNKSAEFEAIAKVSGLADTQSLRFAYVLGQDAWFGLLNPAGDIVGYSYQK